VEGEVFEEEDVEKACPKICKLPPLKTAAGAWPWLGMEWGFPEPEGASTLSSAGFNDMASE